MTRRPRFALLPTAQLAIHEHVDEERVRELAREIAATGRVEEPIWVADESWVILNGHHRFAALRQLGAARVPAWVVDYHDPMVELARWEDGPELSKQEVIRRARAGEPFPPKTTKHRLPAGLPSRPTALADLLNGRRSDDRD